MDTYRHQGLRKRLVSTLKKKGINDLDVLDAFMAVPRHAFLDSAFDEMAYRDIALPIDCDQTISQPYTVAYQTILLKVKRRMKVLEVGTGSGYQAAILSKMGARVFTVERHKMLYKNALKTLQSLNIYARHFFRDGFQGLKEHAPFDRIIITAACEEVPKALIEQLKVGGILVSPVNDSRHSQLMTRIKVMDDGKWNTEVFDRFRFVPMLEGLNNN